MFSFDFCMKGNFQKFWFRFYFLDSLLTDSNFLLIYFIFDLLKLKMWVLKKRYSIYCWCIIIFYARAYGLIFCFGELYFRCWIASLYVPIWYLESIGIDDWCIIICSARVYSLILRLENYVFDVELLHYMFRFDIYSHCLRNFV